MCTALVETAGWLNVVSDRNPHSERGLHVYILYDVFSKPINYGPTNNGRVSTVVQWVAERSYKSI